MNIDNTDLRRLIHRRVVVKHRGKVKTWKDKITLASALAELGGDAEANLGRLRTGQTLRRQRMLGKCFPVYVRFEYREDVRPRPAVERVTLGGIDRMHGAGPTL